jgi:hypothetical protein
MLRPKAQPRTADSGKGSITGFTAECPQSTIRFARPCQAQGSQPHRFRLNAVRLSLPLSFESCISLGRLLGLAGHGFGPVLRFFLGLRHPLTSYVPAGGAVDRTPLAEPLP